MSRFKFPSAYTVLMFIIVVMAVLTWIVPAGQYERQQDEALDREVPIPGTYHQVEPEPQGFFAVAMAPIAGWYNPETGEVNAFDVSAFVLFIGGFLAVVTKTGAIDAGIARITAKLKGREKWMIPILMTIFAAGGTVYGMAEETIPFYLLVIPVVIAAGYDSVTGVAIVMIGAAMGTLGSTINAFATVIASNAAGVPFTDGIYMRALILVVGLIVCILYVMRYAERVRKDPSRSLVADQKESNEAHFLDQGAEENAATGEFTTRHKIILILFGITFGIMIWGVSAGGWWMSEMSALFFVSAIIIGVFARLSEEELTSTFVSGAADLLGVALVIGIARGIVVIMDAGMITDTFLEWSAQAVQGLSTVAFINTMYWIEVGLSFLVPSSSGLAVLTMPIMAPLADFSGVSRDLVVTAYQSASGLVNFITPTSGVVMGGLALGRVSYAKWLRFNWPLMLILTVIIMAALSFGAFTTEVAVTG